MQNCVKGSSLTDRRLSASDKTKRNFKKPVHFTNDYHSQKDLKNVTTKRCFYKQVEQAFPATGPITLSAEVSAAVRGIAQVPEAMTSGDRITLTPAKGAAEVDVVTLPLR